MKKASIIFTANESPRLYPLHNTVHVIHDKYTSNVISSCCHDIKHFPPCSLHGAKHSRVLSQVTFYLLLIEFSSPVAQRLRMRVNTDNTQDNLK